MTTQFDTAVNEPSPSPERSSEASTVDKVDERAPRFGQALTAGFLALGIGLQQPLLIGLVAVSLTTAAVTGWRIDPWAILWKRLAIPIAGQPSAFESAAPHRFAKVMGVAGTVLASLAFLANLPLIGYAIATPVMLAAALGATTGFCLGCKLYGQVRFFQRLNLV